MADIQLPGTIKRCICGHLPAAAKAKGGGWVLACPKWRACDKAPTGGAFPTLAQAVEGWDYTIDRLQKEAEK